jgi:SAM-dependent methyltransferase
VRRPGFWKRWVEPVFPIRNLLLAPKAYARYIAAWKRYRNMPGAEALAFRDGFPQLFDAIRSTPFDAHYFYQAVWASERIARIKPSRHVDVGSHIDFVGTLTTHVPVMFIDIRPLHARLPRLLSVAADILTLPFASGTVESLSCLHVAEHIGLGRYGDPLNPAGTRQACAELARVVTPGGNLYFSTPVGRPRVCFNAHRIHSPAQVLDYFQGLDLAEFSAVDDHGNLIINADCDEMGRASYGCGLFWFHRGMA